MALAVCVVADNSFDNETCEQDDFAALQHKGQYLFRRS